MMTLWWSVGEELTSWENFKFLIATTEFQSVRISSHHLTWMGKLPGILAECLTLLFWLMT